MLLKIVTLSLVAKLTLGQQSPPPNDPLTLRNGQTITSAEQWWTQRRPEIVEHLEREVLGYVPANGPKVTWSVKSKTPTNKTIFPVIEKHLNGHGGKVDIDITLVTPANAKGPVPVMIMFSRFVAGNPEIAKIQGTDPPSTEQLLANGWGYALLDVSGVQADDGTGVTNHGRPSKPDDWGVLRAWSSGASCALDYFETDNTVDSKRVGIEGASRYGRAALVTMAFDPRFAVALIGSPAEGTGNWREDATELIALCAPRPIFISYGRPESGDAKSPDSPDSFIAAVAAGSVFRLLGAKDLGIPGDDHNAQMPPVNQGLLDGQLAWRQHDAGHTDAPNWKYFIPWANKWLDYHSTTRWEFPADTPVFRTDANSLVAHAQLLAKAKQGGIDVYFEGDSITRRWDATDYPILLDNWKQNFFGWNAADFGWGADRTQNILWRLQNGELDGVNPKVVVLLAGTNNVSDYSFATDPAAKVEDITRGLKAIVETIHAKAPAALIVVMGIFPRNDRMSLQPIIAGINDNLAKLADGQKIRYLNINNKLADSQGKLFDGMLNPTDKLHPVVAGYQVWADALRPLLTELLGPPAAADHAPPATGDPSSQRQQKVR